MRKQLLSGIATLAAAALLIVAMAAPAAARIECRGNFQVTKYGLISTPYCEEEQIARRRAKLWFESDRGGGSQQSAHEGLSLPGLWLRHAVEGILRGLRARAVRPLANIPSANFY